MFIYTQARTHARTHASTHARTHAHTHTHTFSFVLHQVLLPSRSATTWGRVVALFAVAAGLAEDCVNQGG